MKDNTARLQRAVGLLVLVVALGALWYYAVEGFAPVDALFMAVITVTTVGYREVEPLDTGGKIFTIGFVLAGVGLAFYTVVALAESLLMGEVAEVLGMRRESRRVRKMEGHHVICGFGRVGQSIAHELRDHALDFVIIDRDPGQQPLARSYGYLMVQGDATEEPVLREAGVERARVLIAAADSDAGNTFVTLTARALNPQLTIIARAASDAGARRMLTAGADHVISPYQIAGHRMALAAVQRSREASHRRTEAPDRLVEVVVNSDTEGVGGKTVGVALGGLSSVHVLAVRRARGEILPGPASDHVLRADDRLMLYGAQDEIDALCADEGLDAVVPALEQRALGSSLTTG